MRQTRPLQDEFLTQLTSTSQITGSKKVILLRILQSPCYPLKMPCTVVVSESTRVWADAFAHLTRPRPSYYIEMCNWLTLVAKYRSHSCVYYHRLTILPIRYLTLIEGVCTVFLWMFTPATLYCTRSVPDLPLGCRQKGAANLG
jgi:hypothetical protein